MIHVETGIQGTVGLHFTWRACKILTDLFPTIFILNSVAKCIKKYKKVCTDDENGVAFGRRTLQDPIDDGQDKRWDGCQQYWDKDSDHSAQQGGRRRVIACGREGQRPWGRRTGRAIRWLMRRMNRCYIKRIDGYLTMKVWRWRRSSQQTWKRKLRVNGDSWVWLVRGSGQTYVGKLERWAHVWRWNTVCVAKRDCMDKLMGALGFERYFDAKLGGKKHWGNFF